LQREFNRHGGRVKLQYNQQVSLIKNLTQKTFSQSRFDCVFVICKSPQLLTLLSCFFAKKTIKKPYQKGTCFYSPINDDKYRKISIVEQKVYAGNSGYFFLEKKGRGELCSSWKPETWFDEQAILALEQDSQSWIEGNNVAQASLKRHPKVLFPTVVSTKSGFEACLSVDITQGRSLGSLLNIRTFGGNAESIKFVSKRQVEPEEQNLIWVNAIPQTIKGKKQVVFISHNYSKFDQLKVDIDDLYLESETPRILTLSDLTRDIRDLVAATNVNMPVSIWRAV
jgi:hypothetical protein